MQLTFLIYLHFIISVAQGVKYFKESRNTEALQCYNFAIEVEPTNPDAYVARGAL